MLARQAYLSNRSAPKVDAAPAVTAALPPAAAVAAAALGLLRFSMSLMSCSSRRRSRSTSASSRRNSSADAALGTTTSIELDSTLVVLTSATGVAVAADVVTTAVLEGLSIEYSRAREGATREEERETHEGRETEKQQSPWPQGRSRGTEAGAKKRPRRSLSSSFHLALS